MKKEQYHHGDLRTCLLKTTIEMMNETGVDSVTMRALSQRVGVSRTAPYRHFTDKSELLHAVAEAGFNKLAQALREIRQTNDLDEVKRLQLMLKTIVLFAASNTAYYTLMFEHLNTIHDIKHPLYIANDRVFKEILMMIALCQQAHKIRPENTLGLTHMTWALTQGLANLAMHKVNHKKIVNDEFFTFTIDTLIDGFKGNSSSYS